MKSKSHCDTVFLSHRRLYTTVSEAVTVLLKNTLKTFGREELWLFLLDSHGCKFGIAKLQNNKE